MNIMISGNGIGAGKTHIAKAIKGILEERGESVDYLPIAQYIKDIATEVGWNNKKDKKGRAFLQNLGDILRTYDELAIIKQWGLSQSIKEFQIADDMRYPCELRFVQKGWYFHIHVVGIVQPNLHPTETTAWRNYNPDLVVINSPHYLYPDQIVDRILKKREDYKYA